MRVRLVAAQFV
jgi:hypothetical protein